MSLVNPHSMDYIATLIELLVKKGREPEMEFQFHGKTYVIVAYQDGIHFQECRSEGNPDSPIHSLESIWVLFRSREIEGIDFQRDWPYFETFDCLDFTIPVEGSDEQKILFRELNERGGIPV